MSKLLDNIYKHSAWIVIILSLIGYMAYRTMSFDGTIEQTLQDPQTWVHMAFVIFLNVTMVSSAYDSATSYGMMSVEFDLADKLNNKIITSANNEMENFRKYVKTLNNHELQRMRDDFLFSVGDKKLDELTEKELKEYNKLKPIIHDIYGFNLPLYYEITKGGKVKYNSSIKKNENKGRKRITRVVTGVLFGGLTINMAFSLGNVGDAFVSLLIISVGLAITYIMTFIPQSFKFKYEIPKKVLLKKTLYDSFTSYKNGTHKLIELEEEKKEL